MKRPPTDHYGMPREEFSSLWERWHQEDLARRIEPLHPWQRNIICKLYKGLGYAAACDTLEGWETA